MDQDGASKEEQLLYAARTDNLDLYLELISEKEDLDINCSDGLGNTPLHLAVSYGSTTVLEHILTHAQCDVDPQNRLERATPLHLAIKIKDTEVRRQIVDSLLDAGADTKIKDKHGETVFSLLGDRDPEIRQMIRRAQAQATISNDDIAEDDDDNDGPGTDSD